MLGWKEAVHEKRRGPAGRRRGVFLRGGGEPRRGGGDLPGALWYVDDHSTARGLNALLPLPLARPRTKSSVTLEPEEIYE